MKDAMKLRCCSSWRSAVYSVTWAGIGIAFPLLIMALVPLRQHVIVKMFHGVEFVHLTLRRTWSSSWRKRRRRGSSVG